MDQYSRRIIGFSVHQGNLNGMTVCIMLNKVISGLSLPTYLSSANDPILLFHRFRTNLRILEKGEINSLPHIPISHPFIERLIRICRNEPLDRIIFWNERDLQRKLTKFQHYFNNHRSHLEINGKSPNQVATKQSPTVIDINNYQWESHYRDLFQLPAAA